MSHPLVTVLMPVYNAERYVSLAVNSILQQTYTYYEFLILNDGSTDRTETILRGFRDPRIVLMCCPHEGLIPTLNKGIESAAGDYLAIMHADDIARRDRLEKQVAYLNAHPDIGILGSTYDVMDASGRLQARVDMPADDLCIRWICMLGNPFSHPTVMMRRRILIDHSLRYEHTFEIVEDYYLWTKILQVTRGTNLRKTLLKYRMHPDTRTSQNRSRQLSQQDTIAAQTIKNFIPDYQITLDEVSALRALFIGGAEDISEISSQRVHLGNLYLDLLEAYLSVAQAARDGEIWRKKETILVANLVLRPPFISGQDELSKRLLLLEPALPIYIKFRRLREKLHRLNYRFITRKTCASYR